MRIDHVILACAELSETAARLRDDHGLRAIAGGEHPAWGTANLLVPAGSAYLELMAVQDRTAAEQNPLGQWLLAYTAAGDRLAGVALEPDDLDAECRRLGLTATPGSRVTPEGITLTWRLAGMEAALTRMLPFFIAWDGPHRAAADEADGGVVAHGIDEVLVGGDPAVVGDWVGTEVPGLGLVGGEPGVHSVTLRTDRGPVTLR